MSKRSTKIDILRCFLCAGLILGTARGHSSADDPKTEAIPLFNGKNLNRLSTWLKDDKKEDPRKVFQVENGLIHISGAGPATSRPTRNTKTSA